jgi:RNase H-fold protein (predicted Holliday junction resolvase)
MVINHGVITGTTLVSRLTPMKRILCLCPVPVRVHVEEADSADTCTSIDVEVTRYSLGVAMSDPYLSFASPVSLEVPIFLQAGSVNNMPESTAAFADSIGLNDFGAITLALPLKFENYRDASNLIEARESILERMQGYRGDCSHDSDEKRFGLISYIDERLTIDQAIEMASEEPDMWDSIDLESHDPSVHASIALNSFLWKHTGGWHNNTFG